MYNQPTGIELRDEGIYRAITKADTVSPNWSERAYEWAVKYLDRLSVGETVLGVNIRNYAEANGFEEPHSKRAWGAIIKRLAKSEKIRWSGYTSTPDPKNHCANISRWVKN